MSTDTDISTWSHHLSLARARVRMDLRLGDKRERPRYAAANRAHIGKVWARSSEITRHQRWFARAFHGVCASILFVLVGISVLAPPRSLPDAVLAAAPAVWVAAWEFLAGRTRSYREQALLPISSGDSKYRWVMWQQAREALHDAARTHLAARELEDTLESMRPGIEELVREEDALTRALEDYRFAATYSIDVADTKERLAAVTAKLDEVTAVHLAAATFIASTSIAGQTPTKPAGPVELKIPEHLTVNVQRDVDRAMDSMYDVVPWPEM